MGQIITIEDIAKSAGVGRGTVDRVLHNRGRVSEETRARVLKCVTELGYKPNKTARMLANKKEYKIAVTFHDLEKEFWIYVKNGIDKAEDEFSSLGVEINRFILPRIDVDAQLAVINHVIENHYDGLAITPYYSQKIIDALNRAVDNGIKVVTFNNDEECRRCCYVGQDMFKSGQTAGRLMSLMAKRNSNYAVILPTPNKMSALDRRYPGFRDIVEKERPDLHLVGAYHCQNENEGVFEIVDELLREKEIKSIYVTNGIVADVARAVEHHGLAKKLLIIGHDLNEPVLEYVRKGTIQVVIGQGPEVQGYTAVSKLCANLLAGEDISRDYYTKIEIILAENEMFRSD